MSYLNFCTKNTLGTKLLSCLGCTLQCRLYSKKLKINHLAELKDVEKKSINKEVFGKRLRGDVEDDVVETIEEKDLSMLSAVPEDYRRCREARVFQRSKNVMQQGTNNTHQWILDFNTEQRWENPTMGWCSSGDSLSNIYMEFPDACSAVCFAQKEGFKVNRGKSHAVKEIKKTYAENFSWRRRTRIYTK